MELGSLPPRASPSALGLTVPVREHQQLERTLHSEAHLPRGQRNVPISSMRHIPKLLVCRTAVRKSQYTETYIWMKMCQESRKCQGLFWSLPVQVENGLLVTTSYYSPVRWGIIAQPTPTRLYSVWPHALRKPRGSSCRGHHLKKRGAIIINVKMRD